MRREALVRGVSVVGGLVCCGAGLVLLQLLLLAREVYRKVGTATPTGIGPDTYACSEWRAVPGWLSLDSERERERERVVVTSWYMTRQ